MALDANATTYERKVLQNYLHDKVNDSERRPFGLIFRLTIVLCDSYQADEIVMEIEEWKQKVPDNYV